jgi:PPOX class probable F420-dependent enzyme
MTELSSAVREFLQGVHFAVVATIKTDGMPHQTVIWYELEGDALIISTPEGSLKQKHLERDSRLSVCVEDGYRYVTLTGTAILLPDPDRSVYGRMGARYQGTFAARAEAAPTTVDSRMAELLSRSRTTIRMQIEQVQANGLG